MTNASPGVDDTTDCISEDPDGASISSEVSLGSGASAYLRNVVKYRSGAVAGAKSASKNGKDGACQSCSFCRSRVTPPKEIQKKTIMVTKEYKLRKWVTLADVSQKRRNAPFTIRVECLS